MTQQISVFAENKKGTFRRMTKLLSDNNINIIGSVTNDSAEYGIVRLIVSDTNRAKALFDENGYLCKLDKVIAVIIDDEPGCLDSLLEKIEQANINIGYIYITFSREEGKPIAVLKVDEIYEVEQCLNSNGYRTL